MSDLSRVEKLAQILLAQQAQVAELEQLLARAKVAALQTERNDLPELMHEVGLSEIKLEDGTKIAVTDEVECAISEANRFAAHQWLRDHGFGGLIGSSISVSLPRDEERETFAERVIDALAAQGLDQAAAIEERVHPSTLKAFVKEQLAEGREIPEGLFSLFPYSRARVKLPKK